MNFYQPETRLGDLSGSTPKDFMEDLPHWVGESTLWGRWI
jgi:hypothetical protein